MDFKAIDWKGQIEKTLGFVTKKAGEVKDVTKIKYQVFDLNNDVKKLYFEIGKKVYEEMGMSPALPDDVLMKCEILEAKLAKIEALKAKESKIANGEVDIICPVCGNLCDVEENFCPVCGASLIEEVDAEVEASAGDEQ